MSELVVGILVLVAAWSACTGALVTAIKRDTKPAPPDTIDEVNRLLGLAKHYRDQQEAVATAFIDLHDVTTDFEVDELYHVIQDNPTHAEYAAAMVRIMNYRYPVERQCRND